MKTGNYVNITLWTEIEITAMILCTCTGSLRPLLIRFLPTWLTSLAKLVTAQLSSNHSRRYHSKLPGDPKSPFSGSSPPSTAQSERGGMPLSSRRADSAEESELPELPPKDNVQIDIRGVPEHTPNAWELMRPRPSWQQGGRSFSQTGRVQ
jgi:hypothetical protein